MTRPFQAIVNAICTMGLKPQSGDRVKPGAEAAPGNDQSLQCQVPAGNAMKDFSGVFRGSCAIASESSEKQCLRIPGLSAIRHCLTEDGQAVARFFVVFCLTFVTGCGPKPSETPSKKTSAVTVSPRELTVAAASDLKFALGEIIAEYEKAHADVRVKVTFGSSGNFFSQLSNQAPFDVYLSADVAYPKKLVELGLAEEKSFFIYAIGQVVVWVPKNSPLDVESRGIEVLKDPSIQKIAIANPKHAPYGRAAESALKELGIYDQIADRLVMGDNVAQTAQFVESGAADIGIISLSLASVPPLRDSGRFWIIPQSAYPKMEQGGLILSWAKEKSEAEQFRTSLMGDTTRTMLLSHGFQLPERD